VRSSGAPIGIASLDVLILCGGLGTRLREVVPDRPKGLAEVAGRPFLDILVDQFVRHGFRRFVLCAGHGSDQISAHYRHRKDAEFVVSIEPNPLGTGGAVRHALAHVRSDPFLVANGDSICDVNYEELARFHRLKGSDLTIVVIPQSGRGDVGSIDLAADDQVQSFEEKAQGTKQSRYVNAGIYLMQHAVVSELSPNTAFSLERDVFPQAVKQRKCYGYPARGRLIDIGTPDRYRAAQHMLRDDPS
jgi:NDP-sugar pyrophosphorylase family protein